MSDVAYEMRSRYQAAALNIALAAVTPKAEGALREATDQLLALGTAHANAVVERDQWREAAKSTQDLLGSALRRVEAMIADEGSLTRSGRGPLAETPE